MRSGREPVRSSLRIGAVIDANRCFPRSELVRSLGRNNHTAIWLSDWEGCLVFISLKTSIIRIFQRRSLSFGDVGICRWELGSVIIFISH